MAYTASRERIAPVYVKSQVNYGDVNAAPGADDSLLTVDSPNVTSVSFDMIPYRPHSASLTRQLDLVGPQMANVALSFWMAGSGTAGSTNVNGFRSIAALWRASGAFETIANNVSITYTPASIAQMRAANPSATTTGPANVWAEMDGALHKVNGVHGNMRMTGSPRSGVVCSFTGMGFYAAPTLSTIGTFTPGSLSYPLFRANNTSCTVAAGATTWAPVLQSFTFDTGADVQRIESANASTGIQEHIFVDRNPTLELTFAMTTAAGSTTVLSYADLHAHWAARTTHNVVIRFGAGTGGQCTLAAPKAQIVNLSPGVTNGVRTMTVSYKVQSDTNDAEWNLAIATPA